MNKPAFNLDLWQELKVALTSPQDADLHELCNLLDWAIAQLPDAQQLDVAGKAIEQMVDLYVLRFQALMAVWEGSETLPDQSMPVLDLEAIEFWVRQSMSVDFDRFVEQMPAKRPRQRQKLNSEDSIIAVIEPETALGLIDAIEAEQNQVQMIQQLAGEEDPRKWSAIIAQWLKLHPFDQPIQFTSLLRTLDLPWVEIWLGLLLGQFALEQADEFYGEILIGLPNADESASLSDRHSAMQVDCEQQIASMLKEPKTEGASIQCSQ